MSFRSPVITTGEMSDNDMGVSANEHGRVREVGSAARRHFYTEGWCSG